MDQELIASLEAQFREANQRMETFHRETMQRFEQVEDTARQTLKAVEDLRRAVSWMGQGLIAVNEGLERLRNQPVVVDLDQVKGWISPYFSYLDSRIRALENTSDLRRMDVLDAVCIMLGKPPLHQPQPTET